MTYILPFGQAHGEQAWRTGPKAARLSESSTTRFCVPTSFAISTVALGQYVVSNGQSEYVSAALKRFYGQSFEALGDGPARLREHLFAGTLPDDLVAELR